jgi:glycosyltransferase involved in cell wall biosynthesis
VIVHAGNLGFYGAWETLIRGIQMLASEGVGLVFVGEGAMKGKVEEYARDCRNVRFLPFRPVAEVPHVMAAGDLHAITVKRGLEGVVVPSKVYNILAAGRPLLAVATAQTEVTRFSERDGCGVSADPDDPQAVANAVRAVLHAPARLASMSRNARELARTYDRVKQFQTFVETIEEAGRA